MVIIILNLHCYTIGVNTANTSSFLILVSFLFIIVINMVNGQCLLTFKDWFIEQNIISKHCVTVIVELAKLKLFVTIDTTIN